MEARERKEYPYRMSWGMVTLCFLVFGSGTVVFALEAANNTRGLVINRLISLEPRGASIFYAALAVTSGLFVLAALLVIWQRLTCPQRVILETNAIVVPKGPLSREVVSVPYADIQDVSVLSVMGQNFIRVEVREGRRRDIAESQLGKAAFDEIVEALHERAKHLPPLKNV